MVKTECGSSLFYTTRGIIKTNLLLKDAEENLANSGFIRTHKSFIVNSNMIREIIPYFNDTFILVMQHYEKEEVPVSRHFMKSFKSIIGLKWTYLMTNTPWSLSSNKALLKIRGYYIFILGLNVHLIKTIKI